MVSPIEGRVAVAVNDAITFATRYAITSFTSVGAMLDRIESPIGGVTQMQPDASGQIHLGGLLGEPDGRVAYHAQLLEYRRDYRAFPGDVFATPELLAELQSQGRLGSWSTFSGTWNCLAIPCNVTFSAALSGNNAGWKKLMTKPTTISLPQDTEFTTFSFSLEDKSASKLLYQVDRTLIDNGIKSIKIETNWNYATLTVVTTTDGSTIPLTLIGKTGKVIGELKTIAPGRKVFSDRVAEPVSYIRITAPPIAPSVSVFPNPTNGKFPLALDQTTTYPLQLAIYDPNGNQVYEPNIYTTDVVLNNPLPGVYIFKLTGSKLNVTKQLQIK